MAPTQTYYDLLDAFSANGCPICRLALHAVAAYIDGINYEYVNDPAFRAEVEPAWGFCNLHAQQWLHDAHVLGTALIYDAVLSQISEELRRFQPRPAGLLDAVTALFSARNESMDSRPELSPRGQCPACRARAEQERIAIDCLWVGLGTDPAFREAFATSAGLCLPHLRLALQESGEVNVARLLREHALTGFDQLRGQLREIVRKNDYRFRNEPAGAERGAAERAVRMVAGTPGIRDR